MGMLCLLVSACTQPESPTEIKPETVVLDSGRAPTAAIDHSSGRAYVSWFEKGDDGVNVFLASKEPSSPDLSDPVQVNSIPGDATLHAQAPAQVVVGPEGNVYVVWTNDVPAEGRIFAASNLRFARSVDGGKSFEPTITVNSDGEGLPSGHTFHDIAVGPDGTVYVAWLDSRERDRQRQALIDVGVMPKAEVDGDDMHSKMAAIEAESKLDLPGTQLWMSVSRDGGQTFDEGFAVADETCNCCRVSIEVAGDGTVYLAWRHIFQNSERDIAIAASTDGGKTFEQPVRVHDDRWELHGCPHTGPTVAIDSEGRVHIAWYTGVETHPGLYYAVSNSRGRSFSDPVKLGSASGVSQVKIGSTNQKDIWVTWEEAGQIQFAYANGDGSLDFAKRPASEGTYPTVAVSDSYWILATQTESSSEIQVRPTTSG